MRERSTSTSSRGSPILPACRRAAPHSSSRQSAYSIILLYLLGCQAHAIAIHVCLWLPDQDRPLFTKDGRIIFASTHRPAKKPRQGWTAIYSLSGGNPLVLLLQLFPTAWRAPLPSCPCMHADRLALLSGSVVPLLVWPTILMLHASVQQ